MAGPGLPRSPSAHREKDGQWPVPGKGIYRAQLVRVAGAAGRLHPYLAKRIRPILQGRRPGRAFPPLSSPAAAAHRTPPRRRHASGAFRRTPPRLSRAARFRLKLGQAIC